MPERQAITGSRTMWELIERRATASPDHPMLIDAQGLVLTFGQFRDRAERVAAGLHRRGLGPGSVVSWQLPSRIDTVVLSMALSRLGAVQNPIIHLYREREVGFALRQTGAESVRNPRRVARDRLRRPGRAGPPGLAERTRAPDRRRGPSRRRPRRPPPAPEGTAPGAAPIRWIYYTSGSTADPKGVRHTDQTLIAGGWGLAVALDMSPDDVGSIAFPFAHIAGPDYLVTMLSLGFPAVIVEAFWSPRCSPSSAATGPRWWGAAPRSTWPTSPNSASNPGTPSCPPSG